MARKWILIKYFYYNLLTAGSFCPLKWSLIAFALKIKVTTRSFRYLLVLAPPLDESGNGTSCEYLCLRFHCLQHVYLSQMQMKVRSEDGGEVTYLYLTVKD